MAVRSGLGRRRVADIVAAGSRDGHSPAHHPLHPQTTRTAAQQFLPGSSSCSGFPPCTVPRGLHRLTALLASASLYIYVTHWLVYPLVDPAQKGLAVAASLTVGVAYWATATRAMGNAERWLRDRRNRRRPVFTG